MSRGRPAPAPAFGGWFVHVEQPDQVARYVFPRLDAGRLRLIGAAIREPHILLKLPVAPDAVQAALGPDWDSVRTGWFMRTELPVDEAPLPDGFSIRVEEGPSRQYRLFCPRGEEAARARLTVLARYAAVDSVDTEPAFRRRGLASAMMQRLVADARKAGARVGLLTATDAGLMVYQRLGWTLLAPWTTAQLKIGLKETR
jgi:GNAT superfamily N-acetyltransferase